MKTTELQRNLRLISFLILIGIMIYLTDIKSTFFFFVSFIIFIIPGILLYKLIYDCEDIKLIFIGSPIGIGISCLLCAITGFFFAFNQYYFIMAITSITFFLILILGRRKRLYPKENLRIDKKDDLNIVLFCSIAIISILLIIPYESFGKLTVNGYAFKDLHSTDLLHHMSVFVHLPKGIPPKNPYFSDGPWNYYWFSHLFPAFVYSLSDFELFSRDVMILTSLTYSILFLGTLFYLINNFYNNKKIIAFLMIISLVAYGYNDIFVLFKHIVLKLPESCVRLFHLNYFIMDEYGEQYTGYSHGWFRNFLVEPHSTLALSLLFVLISSIRNQGLIFKKVECLFQGLLLGIIISIDAFIGSISICWYFTDMLIKLLKKDFSFKKFISTTLIVLLPITLILFILFSLGVLIPGSNHLVFKPYIRMIVVSPLYFLIDYGPMSIFGSLGLLFLVRSRNFKNLSPLIGLTIICIFFMFFINLENIGSTQMIRKGGMIIRIPLIIFSGLSLAYLFEKYNNKKILAILGLTLLMAIPTPFIDIYMISNTKAKSGIDFVKIEDFKAYRWIRQNLPKDCVIQDFPSGATPLLAFAERRVALADWEHARGPGGAGTEKVAERHKKIRELFKTEDINLAYNIIKEYGIDYIYINQRTIQKFREGCKKFESYRNLFKKVYSKDGISIYECLL